METSQTKRTHNEIENAPLLFRLPGHNKVDPWFGLNRSALNALILPTKDNNFSPPVKSISMKIAGRERGRRLVVFESAKAYFDKLREEQDAA